MVDTINEWIVAIVRWMEIIPIQGWAVLVGVFIGGMFTQWLKRTFPLKVLFPLLPPAICKMWIRLSALIFAALPTYFIWPDDNAIWAAMAVGFATPTIYRLGSVLVYNKWPHLRERFSGTSNGK